MSRCPESLEERQRQLKMKFSPEEDDLIREAMQQGNFRGWATIAEAIPNRTARQIRERWVNYLNPDVNHAPWTLAEEEILKMCVAELGQQWSKMVSFFENRTDIAIKNHHQLMQRRQNKIWKMTANLLPKKDRVGIILPRKKAAVPPIIAPSRENRFPSMDEFDFEWPTFLEPPPDTEFGIDNSNSSWVMDWAYGS
jgi:myb proto-oncogene protein